MAIEHRHTSVIFTDTSNLDSWEVMYFPTEESISVEVYCNRVLEKEFDSIPESVKSKAKHPNKTQAEAIIKLVKKEKKNEES